MPSKGKRPGEPPPPDDWSSAVDEWDAQLDHLVGGENPPGARLEYALDSAKKRELPEGSITPLPPPPVSPRIGHGGAVAEDPLISLFDGDELQLPDGLPQALGSLLGEVSGDEPTLQQVKQIEAIDPTRRPAMKTRPLPRSSAGRTDAVIAGRVDATDEVTRTPTPRPEEETASGRTRVLGTGERVAVAALDAQVGAADQDDDDEVEMEVIGETSAAVPADGPLASVEAIPSRMAPERRKVDLEALDRLRSELDEMGTSVPDPSRQGAEMAALYDELSIDILAPATDEEDASSEMSIDFGFSESRSLPPSPIDAEGAAEPELDGFDIVSSEAAEVIDSRDVEADPSAPKATAERHEDSILERALAGVSGGEPEATRVAPERYDRFAAQSAESAGDEFEMLAMETARVTNAVGPRGGEGIGDHTSSVTPPDDAQSDLSVSAVAAMVRKTASPGVALPADARIEVVDPPMPASRLVTGFGPLTIEVETGSARTLDVNDWRDRMALLDGERLLVDAERASELACAAGRAALRAGDPGAARERFEAALDLVSTNIAALRGLRRLAFSDGRLDEAKSLIERELDQAGAKERGGLIALRAEILLVSGERDAARAAFRELVAIDGEDLVAALGLIDVAVADGGDDLRAAIETLPARVRDPKIAAAFEVEVGRLAEAAGDDAAAAVRFQSALDRDAGIRAAALGKVRISLRQEDGPAKLVEALTALASLVGGDYRVAIDRTRGRLLLAAGDAAGAIAATEGAVDHAGLMLRARAEAALGSDAAIASLEQAAAALSDGGVRSDALMLLGAHHERAGRIDEAMRAFERAFEAAPTDTQALLAIERIDRARGNLSRLIASAQALAALDPNAAEAALLRAARLLVEAERPADAITELDAALATNPLSSAALSDRIELALAADHELEAAEILARSARSHAEAGDAETASILGERAARLFARRGDTDRALAEAHRLLDSDLAGPAQRLMQRLLAAQPGRVAALAEALAAEAEQSSDSARVVDLWHRRGIVLESAGREAACESQRRALSHSPTHPPSLLALSLAQSGAGAETLQLAQARIDEAGDRPEAVALHLRVGALHEELGDPASAAQSFGAALRQIAKTAANEGVSAATARAIEERIAASSRLAGDSASAVEVIARFAELEPNPDERFALSVQLAEECEFTLARLDAAAAHYQRAFDLRPASPLAMSGLVRTLTRLGRFAVLAEMALSELKEAPDVARRVQAYEQLAQLDGEHRGDPQSALLSYESILEVDHAHHPTFRVLEKHYLKEQRLPELVHLYEQMGLTAADPRLATAVILDRARLRAIIGGQEDMIESDFRQALFKDGRCRPALRHVLGSARHRRDALLTAELSQRLAESSDTDAGAAAIFLTRAAECLSDLGRTDEAIDRFRRAIQRDPANLSAMRALARIGLENQDFAAAVDGAEAAGRTALVPEEKARAFLIAAVTAEEKLGDAHRALADFRAALAADPRSLETFERIRRLLAADDDDAGLAEALRARIEVENDPARRLALHLDLASLFCDRLGDREQAKRSFREALALDAANLPALAALSELCYGDGEWPEAADALIRRARIDKAPSVLKEVFLKLGLIYSDHTPELRRAVVSFTRVLQFEPDHRVALEYLSNLHVEEKDWKSALRVTARLAELTPDIAQKVERLHRVANIYEVGFKDSRNAHDAMRRALEVDPRHLPAIHALASYYERHNDQKSARVHLDRSVQGLRVQLAKMPFDEAAYHDLFRILGWRRSFDAALTVASLLQALGLADAEEKALLVKVSGKDFYPGAALRDLNLDDQLFHPSIPPGFRNMFRLLDEPLRKFLRSDLRRLGVGKQEKLPRSGHAIREIADRLAADLGVRDFELFVTAALPTAATIELTDPISLILGERLVAGAHEQEVRFHLAGLLRMVHSQMTVPLRMSPDELGVLVGGLVRQFVSDFVPAGFDEAPIAAEAERLSRVVPRKLHNELMPFALECADPSIDWRELSRALVFTSQRAGLLAVGSIGPALAALKRRGDDPQVRELLRFAVTDELVDLRRALGIAIG